METEIQTEETPEDKDAIIEQQAAKIRFLLIRIRERIEPAMIINEFQLRCYNDQDFVDF
jgi:hypothetical protein